MKLTKYQLNELLYRVSNDNQIYGLIMKTAYIYAKKIGEVGNLQTKDINYKDNTITFHVFNQDYKPVTYPLHESITNDLKIITEDKKPEEYIFDEYFPHEKTRKIINNYLIECSKMEGLSFLKLKGLTSQDFRILRGQHLYQDGAKLTVLQELYAHTKISSTKKIIEYSNMPLKEDIDLNTVFTDYTDLNLFCEWDYYNYDNYYCTYNGADGIIEIEEDTIEIIGDRAIRNKLTKHKNLSKELSHLKNPGDYRFINGVKVLKE